MKVARDSNGWYPTKVQPGYAFPDAFTPLARNPILEADSYKLSHPDYYVNGMTGMSANIVARTNGKDMMVFFGLQQWIKSRFLSLRVTMAHIDEAEDFAKRHGEPFNRSAWTKVVQVYGGYVPLTIRAVPEGTKVPSGNVMVTIQCTDPDLFWTPTNRETSLLRGVWYPSTIATNDLKNYRLLKRYANDTCDDLSVVPFQMHDFGGRGVTCGEQAEIGGCAHLVYFMGSDTMEGVRAANYYYGIDMAGFSVRATEHTNQCSFGPLGERDYIDRIVSDMKPGQINAMVIDGYDTFRCARVVCGPDFRDRIRNSGGKLVLRPDSGIPVEVLPELLKIESEGFGVHINTKGCKVPGFMPNHPLGGCIGSIYGDGINYDSTGEILECITSDQHRYASSAALFGSGGGLLQQVNRDTYKWAQKSTAIETGGQWKDIFKDPITDPGKKSFVGRQTLVKSLMNGEFMTISIDKGTIDSEWVDQMVTVLDETQPGKLLVDYKMSDIRERATS